MKRRKRRRGKMKLGIVVEKPSYVKIATPAGKVYYGRIFYVHPIRGAIKRMLRKPCRGAEAAKEYAKEVEFRCQRMRTLQDPLRARGDSPLPASTRITQGMS